MKYAVISDIHGNYPALEAVLDDVRQQGISRFLFAGDYCISGPRPDECVTAIRAIPDKIAIRGNEEKYLENLIGKDPSQWTDGQMQISYWSFRNMSPDNLDYVLSLPYTAGFESCGVKVRMAHYAEDFLGPCAYPDSIGIVEKYAGVDVTPEMLRTDVLSGLERDPAFQEKVSSLEKGIYIFGHSHIQWSYRAEDRGVYLVNPGSCGLPLDGIPDSVPYTVLEITEDGRVQVTEKRVPFDKAAYIRALKQTSQFREAKVWSNVIIRELAKSREHIYYFLAFAERYAWEIGDEKRPFSLDTWESAFTLWNRQQEETEKEDRQAGQIAP